MLCEYWKNKYITHRQGSKLSVEYVPGIVLVIFDLQPGIHNHRYIFSQRGYSDCLSQEGGRDWPEWEREATLGKPREPQSIVDRLNTINNSLKKR